VTRVAGICGLLAFVTMNIGWIAGGIAQPSAYSFANDDISDLGSLRANDAWIYNQLGANLTGGLIVVFAIGLWIALSPSILGRIGAGVLAVGGVGSFLDGFFRLDCRGIDAACSNDSWHSSAHKIESGFTAAALLAAPVILAFAFRTIPSWRSAWIPSLAAVPLSFLVGALFSTIGDGASTRATTVVLFVWIAYVAARLLRTQWGGGAVESRTTRRVASST
jgi:hypothetical protein